MKNDNGAPTGNGGPFFLNIAPVEIYIKFSTFPIYYRYTNKQ